MLRWLPNFLSLTRIGLVPAWLALAVHQRQDALEGHPADHLGLLLLLVVIGATDALDGLIARRFGLTSKLGAVLDAVADKLATFVAVGFLSLFGAPAFTPLPVWLFAALVLRDLLFGFGYLWLLYGHREAPVEHRWHGRAATLVLFFTVAAACARVPKPLVDAMSLTVLALVVPGTWDYLKAGAGQTSHR